MPQPSILNNHLTKPKPLYQKVELKCSRMKKKLTAIYDQFLGSAAASCVAENVTKTSEWKMVSFKQCPKGILRSVSIYTWNGRFFLFIGRGLLWNVGPHSACNVCEIHEPNGEEAMLRPVAGTERKKYVHKVYELVQYNCNTLHKWSSRYYFHSGPSRSVLMDFIYSK